MVEFDSAENAETAICTLPAKLPHDLHLLITLLAKFTGYQYGGRPLGLTFVKYLNAGGDAMDAEQTGSGLTQDQIM